MTVDARCGFSDGEEAGGKVMNDFSKTNICLIQ